METLTKSELIDRIERGPVALFDVRGDVEYEKGHIPGAKTAPLGSLVSRVAGVMNRDSFVALYSDGEGSDLAEQAADRLEALGLRNVYVYEEGVKGWVASGLPLIPSVDPHTDAWGPVVECRPLVVDRERAYGGAFRDRPVDSISAGG